MEQINEVTIDEAFASRFATFGAATVKSRAMPSVEDGLNPVTRRIIYAFFNDGYSLKYKKAAFYVGNVLAHYHPHSDIAVYETMIGLAQSFNKNQPLIEGQGNVGSVANFKSYAAQRYVELRMASFSKDVLFRDMNDKFIPMRDNYDASTKEPIALPAALPMFLVMGNLGIASGFVSEMPTHNVSDVCDVTIKYLTNPEISYRDLTKEFRPDFPMGGVILNEASLPEMYEKGQGVIHVQANIEEGEYNGKPALIVKDLPFRVSTEKILGQVRELLRPHPTTKAPGILDDKLADIKDLSSKSEAVNLVLVAKKDISLPVLKNILLENTSLRSTVKYIPNILAGNELYENASLKTILQKWFEFRVSMITRKTNHIIKTSSEQVLLRKAVLKAQGSIDEVIAIVKTGKSEDDVVARLRKLLGLTDSEARYIANIRLYQIARAEVQKLKDQIDALQADIDQNIQLVSDEDLMREYIVMELQEFKDKYKVKRRTSLTNTKVSGFDVRSVIESEDLVVAISQDNYVYAKPVDEMREYAARGGKGSNFIDAKYKRIMREMFVVNSHDDLLCFTDKGNFIELKGYQLNLWNKPISAAIPDLKDQKVVVVLKVNFEEDADKHFVFVTKQSLMKRIEVPVMRAQRKMAGGNIAIKLAEDDELIGVKLVGSENDRIVITSNHGRMQNLVADQIEVMLRPTSGRGRAKLAAGEVIQCITTIPAEEIETTKILVATKNGTGKLVTLEELPERRGDGGRRALIKIVSLREGDRLLCGTAVRDDSTVVATTAANKSIKIAADKIRHVGRTAIGVRLVTLEEGDTLADVSVV